MRKYLITILALLLLGCSESPPNKAEQLINDYLKESLKDPDSYKNEQLGSLTELSWVGLFIQEDIKKVKSKELSSDGFAERVTEFRSNVESKGADPDSIIAYTLEHKYRAKNSFGGYTKKHVKYLIDKDLKNILDVYDLPE